MDYPTFDPFLFIIILCLFGCLFSIIRSIIIWNRQDQKQMLDSMLQISEIVAQNTEILEQNYHLVIQILEYLQQQPPRAGRPPRIVDEKPSSTAIPVVPPATR